MSELNYNPVQKYVDRYDKQLTNLGLDEICQIDKPIIQQKLDIPNKEQFLASLNNFYMAALGLGTLLLRLGAIIEISEAMHKGDEDEASDLEKNSSLIKQLLANLKDSKPTDTNWRNLLEHFSGFTKNEAFKKCFEIIETKKSYESKLLESFVSIRNDIAHGNFGIDFNSIYTYLDCFKKFRVISEIFISEKLIIKDGYFYLKSGKLVGMDIKLYPFMKFKEPNLAQVYPFLFQGLYGQGTKLAKLINTEDGEEILQSPEETKNTFDDFFSPLAKLLKYGIGDSYEESNKTRQKSYLDYFVGRENEVKSIVEWCNSQSENNILPVYAPAGLGKGALMANVIKQFEKGETKVIYHFCSSGLQNSLHAILYHLIISGTDLTLWKNLDPAFERKLSSLPSKYADLVDLFHKLIEKYDTIDEEKVFDELKSKYEKGIIKNDSFRNSCLSKLLSRLKSYCEERLAKDPTNTVIIDLYKNTDFSKGRQFKNLVIIVDGLDDAHVSYPQLPISDWFKQVDDKGEFINENWQSPKNIRWIFTYRKTEGMKGYDFPLYSYLQGLPSVQPLQPLNSSSLNVALEELNKKRADNNKEPIVISCELINKIILKGKCL